MFEILKLKELILNRFPHRIICHILGPYSVADIQLGANRTDEAPMEFGVTGAILLQRIELLAGVLVDVVGGAVSGHAAFSFKNPYLAIRGLDDVVGVEVVPAEGTAIN